MADLKICRICLRTATKFYKINEYELDKYYEQITNLKVGIDDGLPQYFCFECAAMVFKFHKFKEKCYTGQITLSEMLLAGPITYEAVSKIDRKSTKLLSPLSMITKNSRIKTWKICHKSKIKSEIDKEIEEFDVNGSSDFIDDDFGDTENTVDVNDFDIDKKPNENKELLAENDIIRDSATLDFNLEYLKPIDDLKKSKVVVMKKYTNLKNKVKRKKINGSADLKIPRNKTSGRCLDPKYWKKYSLSDEEALREFKAKAEDKKYLSAPYKCLDCFKGFSKEDIMNRHQKLLHNEAIGPIECHFCRMRFKWKCFLRRHLPQHYTKFKCLRCNLIFGQESTAYFHDDYHKGVTRKCLHCDLEFKHSSTYYTHLRTHRSEHVCTLCGASFVSDAGLRKHKRIKHIGAETIKKSENEEANTYCQRCEIMFETREAYEEHLYQSAMHADNTEGTGAVTKPLAIRKNNMKRRNPRKPTTCYRCGKHFESQAACLKHHLAEHPRTPAYPPNERHICEICGVSVAPASIANHLNTHTKKNVHTCTLCGLQFNSRSSFNRHQVTHTGEKPFACSLCAKRFTQSNSMKLHYRTFHLKQPYPKRNRNKKTKEPQGSLLEILRLEDE